MAAHLPFPIRPNEKGVKLVNFHDAIQYCTKQSWNNRRKARVLKVITALGSTIILFVLSFWSAEPQNQARNINLMYTAKALAFAVSVSSSLNYLLDFQRRADKYESARRVIAVMEATYSHAIRGKESLTTYLDSMELWARNNFINIEKLLDDDKVHDVGVNFQAQALPEAS